mgnify:CR=1 FL=1
MADITTEELEELENEVVSKDDNIKTMQEFVSPESLYQELIASVKKYHPSTDISLIEKAYKTADTAHKGQVRKSGEAYIIHPLCVAIILAELELDKETIVAGLLHDVVEDTVMTVEEIASEFSEEIALLVDGVTKLGQLSYDADKVEVQAENLRKMFLAMAKDIRVILIKLADRLHNMRTLKYMTPEKQKEKARETMDIYAPIAQRLGISKIKIELDDLSLKYLEPEAYYDLVEKVALRKSVRDDYVQSLVKEVSKHIENAGIKAQIDGRAKHFFSIYKKMVNQHKTLDQIYDLFAIRIIVDNVKDCYAALGVIHEMYKPIPGRFKDYIAMPKPNMYQSLHTTLIGPTGQPFEIQIRTFEMHRTAEYGIAAHWKYKEHNIEEDTELDKWLQTITEILESPDPNALDFLDTIKLNLFTSEIFVFTPKGDIKTLPQGATALDFGYALHSDIGNKCIGAKVNHRLVPLSHQLASGDQVEILTSRSQNPQPEWLNFVTTARARARIDAYLKKIRKEAAKEGEIKVIDAFKRNNLEANTSNIDKLCMYFGFSKREEFFYAVEKGDVILPENIHKLLKEKTDNVLFKYVKQALRVATKATTGKKEEEEQPKEKPKYDKKKPYILKEEAFERNYVIADCCKPIPGDESLGFINDDGNVVVHKRSCPIAMRLKSSFGERILNTEWSSHHSSFEATLEIKGIDSIGVLNTITRTISDDFNVNIIRLLIEAKDGVFEGRVKMKVHDVEDIQRMCVVLSKIKNIQSVARVAD